MHCQWKGVEVRSLIVEVISSSYVSGLATSSKLANASIT